MPDTLANFIAVEDSLSGAVIGAIGKQAGGVQRRILAALRRGDEGAAIDALNDLDFSSAVRRASGKIDFLLTEALIVGARSVVPPKQILWNKGEPLPEDVLEPAKEVFEKIITDRAIDYIKRVVLGIIDQEIQDQREEAMAPVQKIADAALAAKLNAAVLGGGRVFADISSNLTTSRLVSFGFLSQARASGIDRYQLEATLDERTSQICRRLHGKTFSVTRSFDHTLDVLKTRAPEDLKAKAPFVDGSKAGLSHLENTNSDELQAQGIMVPPFHPHCRTILVTIGKATGAGRPYTPTRITPPKQPALDTVVRPVVVEPVQPPAATSLVDNAAFVPARTVEEAFTRMRVFVTEVNLPKNLGLERANAILQGIEDVAKPYLGKVGSSGNPVTKLSSIDFKKLRGKSAPEAYYRPSTNSITINAHEFSGDYHSIFSSKAARYADLHPRHIENIENYLKTARSGATKRLWESRLESKRYATRWSVLGDGDDPLRTTTAHEMGHWLDWRFGVRNHGGDYRFTEALIRNKVTLKEKATVSEYAASKDTELFAEVTAAVATKQAYIVPDSILRAYWEVLLSQGGV